MAIFALARGLRKSNVAGLECAAEASLAGNPRCSASDDRRMFMVVLGSGNGGIDIHITTARSR
jgi:hypothetical protein